MNANLAEPLLNLSFQDEQAAVTSTDGADVPGEITPLGDAFSVPLLEPGAGTVTEQVEGSDPNSPAASQSAVDSAGSTLDATGQSTASASTGTSAVDGTSAGSIYSETAVSSGTSS